MGMTAQQPIYVSGVDRNETFGRNSTGLTQNATLCPGCYNEATRTIFWVGGRGLTTHLFTATRGHPS